MTTSQQVNVSKLNTLISRGTFKYFYDVGKLTYAGVALVGIQQNQLKNVIMGLVVSLLLFIAARILEEKCLSHPSLMTH